MTQSQLVKRVIKPAVLVLAAVPALVLLADTLGDRLGANPIEAITHRTGTWGLTFLLITLAVSPLRRMTGIGVLVRFRRMLGLWAFAYLSLHFLTYLVLDHFFYWETIVEDVAKRPFVTVGFASFLLLIPLAATSTKGMVRRLGGARWSKLHRLVYVAAAGGVLHFLWKGKVQETEPVLYAIVLVVLLGMRLERMPWRRARRPIRASPAA